MASPLWRPWQSQTRSWQTGESERSWFVNIRKQLAQVREVTQRSEMGLGWSGQIITGKSRAEARTDIVGKALRQTRRLVLSGTLNGSVVGVPAYFLQGVQSCVTESKLLLCPSLQRGYVDILCAAADGSSTATSSRIAHCCGVGQLLQSLSGVIAWEWLYFSVPDIDIKHRDEETWEEASWQTAQTCSGKMTCQAQVTCRGSVLSVFCFVF